MNDLENNDPIRELKQQLDDLILKLEYAVKDPEIQEKIKKVLHHELEFYDYLLKLENEKYPSKGPTFGEQALEKTKGSWREFVDRIFPKINSILAKVLGM